MLYYVEEEANVFKEGRFRMPTLEERLEVLERAQSAMKIEQIYDVRQLDERITALHRQLAEQRQRLDEQGQAISQLGQTIDVKLDGLMQVLVQQFAAVGARFDIMDQRFVAVDTRFDAIDQRFAAVVTRFDAIDARFTQIDQKFVAVDARFTGLEEQIDRQTVEIRAKFETSDLYATRTWGVVQSQEQDIHTIKERLDQVVNLLTGKPDG